MKVVVTGGRAYADKEAIRRAIVESGATEVAHGGAGGADMFAGIVAKELGLIVRVYPARWDVDGRGAGIIRNRYMLKMEKPDLVLAFPGGRGTAHCVGCAEARGIPVRKIPDTA